MTLAVLPRQEWSSFPTSLDWGLSDDAREIRRIRSIGRDIETSYSFGISKSKVFEELGDAFMEAQENGWDGYGASRAELSALLYALHFLAQLPSTVPSPQIGIDIDGEIAIEWDYGPRRVISIRVGRDGTINYAGLVGHVSFHGVEFLREGIPSTISSGIERVVKASSDRMSP